MAAHSLIQLALREFDGRVRAGPLPELDSM
jgi:hypothetical protein